MPDGGGQGADRALALSRARLAREEMRRAAQSARWPIPLSREELARRAEQDARPIDWTWQAEAVEPGCAECVALGRACPGHLGAWAYRQVAALSGCDACGGLGYVFDEPDGSGPARRRACPGCNASPGIDRRAAAERSATAASVSWMGSIRFRPWNGCGCVLGRERLLSERARAREPRRRESPAELQRARVWWSASAPAAEPDPLIEP